MTDIDFAAQAENERIAFTSYKRKFAIENTPPQNPTAELMTSLSWEFWTSIIVGFSAMLLAGMRTFGKFHEMSVKSFGDTGTALFEAMISIVAIEGVMFVADAIRASKDVSDVGKQDMVINLKRIGFLALFISVAAGMGQALPSLSGLPAWVGTSIDWAILIGLGGGASYVAKVSGGIVGSQIAEAKRSLSELAHAYDQDLSSWNTALKQAWEGSDDRAVARENMRVAGAQSRYNVKGVRSAKSERSFRHNENPGGIREKILAYLRQNLSAAGVPGPSEVSRTLEVSKGYAHEVISEFIESSEYAMLVKAAQDAT